MTTITKGRKMGLRRAKHVLRTSNIVQQGLSALGNGVRKSKALHPDITVGLPLPKFFKPAVCCL